MWHFCKCSVCIQKFVYLTFFLFLLLSFRYLFTLHFEYSKKFTPSNFDITDPNVCTHYFGFLYVLSLMILQSYYQWKPSFFFNTNSTLVTFLKIVLHFSRKRTGHTTHITISETSLIDSSTIGTPFITNHLSYSSLRPYDRT